jgi:hypothetical protein
MRHKLHHHTPPLHPPKLPHALTWKRWATPGALRWEALHRGVWVTASCPLPASLAWQHTNAAARAPVGAGITGKPS